MIPPRYLASLYYSPSIVSEYRIPGTAYLGSKCIVKTPPHHPSSTIPQSTWGPRALSRHQASARSECGEASTAISTRFGT